MKGLFIIFFVIYYNTCNRTNFLFENNLLNESVIINNSSKQFNFVQNYKYKKNLILGIIQKYSLNNILPFFKSFLYANFTNCDVVMFVRNVSKTIIKYLQSIGVLVFEIPEKYINVTVINIRWKMYIDFLKEKKSKYNLVLHTDVVDTIFQKNVFEYYADYEPFIGVAIEDETLNEKVDKKWVIDFAGEEKHKKIQNERLICVGQIWGTIDKFLEFAIIFWEKLQAFPNAIEQGIGNYLFYYEKIFKDCLIKSDNFGPIMTIGLTKRNNIIFDSKQNILNFRGEIASLVHQYDRKPDIVKIIINRFCPELINNKIKRDTMIKKNIFIKNNRYKQTTQIEKCNKETIICFFIILYLLTLILFFKIKLRL